MEPERFTNDDFNLSPCSNQGFQSDRFTKKTTNLNIPDTIHENCSAELSEECLKMEVPKITVDTFSSDDNKENIGNNHGVISTELLNNSANLAIDNSYIRCCERKLLENSYSDEEKNFEKDIKSLVDRPLLETQKMSALHNDTISTPPSLLRKEISMLRNEMVEAHEFHDFEIKLLQEEKSVDVVESEKYIELFERYSALVELYSNLKTEFDECRKNQENMRKELQSKTADYLESICSQIETSENSLNFSSSFVSFGGGLKSSTMMEGVSELEATVLNDDRTIFANDPLSISGVDGNGTFKTPMKTPLKSSKKLFPQGASPCSGKSIVAGSGDVTAKGGDRMSLDSECNIQLLNLETAFYDKVKEVEDLEQRLFKVEDMAVVLHSEFERITSVYANDNKTLKENLLVKTEEMNELTQKLFTETISLDPSLRDSLLDVSGTKLLGVFIETIMENCRKIKNDDHLATIENLRSQLSSQESKLIELEELKTKLSDAEITISIREEEIKMLQSHASSFRQTREELAASKAATSRLKDIEAEKMAFENRCLELETVNEGLMHEVETIRSQLSLARDGKAEIETARLESLDSLKAQMIETETILKSNETEIIGLKENLLSADATVQQLKYQLKSIADENSELAKRCEQLQESSPIYEKLRIENEGLRELVVESEKLVNELKNELGIAREQTASEIAELMREVERVKNENSDFAKLLENVEKRQKSLANLLSDIRTDGDLPSDRVIQLIQNAPSLQDSSDDREREMMSVFAETITKTCKEVQNVLIRNFDNKKQEWETERNSDLNKIKDLEEQIRSLGETSERSKAEIREIISEKEDLIKLHEDLKNRMKEAEKVILSRNEEIQTLKSQENCFKKMKDDLSAADEIVAQLNAQLSALKAEKLEAEQRRCELEECTARLSTENSANVKELDETKIAKEKLENENSELKRQILESEEAVGRFQALLEGAQMEQARRELRIKDLGSEIELLKKEREGFSERLDNLEANNKSLRDVLSDVQFLLDIPENTLEELFSGGVDNKKILNERINGLIKAQVEVLKGEHLANQQAKQAELEELRTTCQSLEEKLSKAQDTISTREEEIRGLQANIKETLDEYACTKAALSKLESRVEGAESESKEAENRCRDLEAIVENLKREAESVESRRKELENQLSEAGENSEIEKDLKESYDALKTQMLEAENTISKRDEEIQVLKSKESSMVNQLEELKQTCEDLRAKLSGAEITMADREERIQVLLSEVSKAREDLASAEEALGSKLKMIETAENRCRDLESVSENLKLDMEASRNVEKEMRTELSLVLEKKALVEDENARLKELYDALKIQMTETKNLISGQLDEIRILKSNENQLEDLKLTCENLKTKLLESERTISCQEEQIKTLQSYAERSRHEISSLRADLLELETQLTVDKAEAEKRCRELEELVESLKKEVGTAECLRAELETQKSEMETENIHLKQTYEALKGQVKEAENAIFNRDEEIRELKSYESQFTAVKENLVSAEETILKLKSQLKSAEDEKFEIENRCSQLQESNQNLRVEINSARNLENNPAYEKIQNENDGLKRKVLEYEAMAQNLKYELDEAKENQRNNIFKVEELIREVEELKRENNGFSLALGTLEETQKNLADVLSDVGNDGDLPGDRVTKVIAKRSKAPDTRETKIVSDFVETISKTCRDVQNELIKKFDSKKLEWETQRDVDLRNLQGKIEILTEENVRQVSVLQRAKEELAETDEVVRKLRAELSSAQTEKDEAERRCRKLEEGTLTLQGEINTKETIIKGLDELRIVREKLENENDDLKRKITESEEVVVRLKKCLKVAQDEQTDRESRIKDFESEIILLKKEKESLMGVEKELKNLDKTHKRLLDIMSELSSHLDLPEDTLTEVLSSDDSKNKKIFVERINVAITTQVDGLKVENKNLKLGNDCLRERVRQLTEIIEETPEVEAKEDPSNVSTSFLHGMNLRSKGGRKGDRYERRLYKLEEINHSLTELLIRILTALEFPELEKLDLDSLGAFAKTTRKVRAHINAFLSKTKELKEENGKLDEECEIYSNIIKDLTKKSAEKDAEIDRLKAEKNSLENEKRELSAKISELDEECEIYSDVIKDLEKKSAAELKANMEKTAALEAEIERLKEGKHLLENEKQELLAKTSKLDAECQKLQNAPKTERSSHGCPCGNDPKRINELKRTILMKEQRLLELQDLEAETGSLKSQIAYLKTALEKEKKKTAEEKEKSKKLQNQLNEATKNENSEKKKSEENKVLEELRMGGSFGGGIVQEFVDKEKMRKLSKDIGILKELCRARYAEIKRLEAVNAALRNAAPKNPSTPKNSNQMDSPIRSRGVTTRFTNQVKDVWKSEIIGKENGRL